MERRVPFHMHYTSGLCQGDTMSQRVLKTLLVCTMVLSGLTGPGASPAEAAAIVVNSTADPGDGTCNATQCTLREAITLANGNGVADRITFDIGTGPQTIAVQTELPNITAKLTIDGTTQPGFAGVPLIELDGSDLTSETPTGLFIQADDSTVKGLVINDFHFQDVAASFGEGILVTGDDVKIRTNYIGTGPSGEAAQPNATGIVIASSSDRALIGGRRARQGNVVSGNDRHNVDTQGLSAEIRNNLIGTDADGQETLDNGLVSLFVAGPGTTVGAPGDGNVIGGSANIGLIIFGEDANSNAVRGNWIGVAKNGSPIPNAGNGLRIGGGATDNAIGGVGPGNGNKIAFNGESSGTGITIDITSAGNEIRGNSIFANGGHGIQLGCCGPIPNDPGDDDTGANNLQNKPVLEFVAPRPRGTFIEGSVNGVPADVNFNVDFFSSPRRDPSGFGEGKRFLGTVGLPSGPSGDGGFATIVPRSVKPGHFVTATASVPNGGSKDTSEFSRARRMCTRIGTGGSDTIRGTSDRDVLCGKGGGDSLVGRGSQDYLVGGRGGDSLRGGRGADVLLGGVGDDDMFGGPGNDTCRQGPGSGRHRSC
jgi:CSLREA domain-containing protein